MRKQMKMMWKSVVLEDGYKSERRGGLVGVEPGI